MTQWTHVALDGSVTVGWTGELAAEQAEAIAEIKDRARARILAICPEWKQTNLVARGTELLMRVHLGGAALTEAEQAEVAAGQAIWDQVKAIRTASDAAEAAVLAAETPAAVWAVTF
jgi:hypothetical protein